MAWNAPQTKSVQTKAPKPSTENIPPSKVPMGAPVALSVSSVGRGYRDGWDIERAYREGMQKVTWVARAIDAIAGNQARLDVMLRKDNSPTGEIVDKDHPILSVLNSKANIGENSFVFRYRMSAQLLLSSRGAFIEKIRTRDGRLAALQLLPPQHTMPIPHPRTFVSGFEVTFPNGGSHILAPEDVIWLRRPHPLDPYLSFTPLEAAGIAVEIENLAKVYNRNFLLNDGRPGGLLVIRGEMDDDDKDELRSRFRGNLNRAGATSVIASDDGVDFVDTSANPRDAAYMQMRQITKDEILSAFGVPESAIGNAAGRTFANAAEELRVFWMETMTPHLEMLARGLDELDPEYYIDFNTSDVPILIIAKQERERFNMEEFKEGAISLNEYRVVTGRKEVDSELADSLLLSPNLTPVANTKKKFVPEPPPQAAAPAAPAAQEPAATEPQAQTPPPAEQAPFTEPTGEPVPANQSSLDPSGLQVKTDDSDDKDLVEWSVKADQATDRWTSILTLSLERLFERQQRVVTEKALGAKARRALASQSLSTDTVFDRKVWDRQIDEDLRPMITAIAIEGAATAGVTLAADDPTVRTHVDDQLARIKEINATTRADVESALLIAMASKEDDGHAMLGVMLTAVFANLVGTRSEAIAGHEAQAAFNFGSWAAGQSQGFTSKTWVTRKDDRVRSAHRHLEGSTVPISASFAADGATLRFPGDPLAPAELTIGCRCKLRIRR